MKNIIPSDLSRLSFEELNQLHWEITEEAYKKCQPIRDEIWKRIQEEKKREQNLQQAS